MAEHKKLNIYSFNANGLGNFKKKKDVFGFLRKQSGNIFITRTHWKTEQENLIRSQWGFECVVAGNQTGSRVVAVLFKNNLYRVSNSQY